MFGEQRQQDQELIDLENLINAAEPEVDQLSAASSSATQYWQELAGLSRANAGGEQFSESESEEDEGDCSRARAGEDSLESGELTNNEWLTQSHLADEDELVDDLYENIMVNRPELAKAMKAEDEQRDRAQPQLIHRLKPKVEDEEEEEDVEEVAVAEQLPLSEAEQKPVKRVKKTALEALNDCEWRFQRSISCSPAHFQRPRVSAWATSSSTACWWASPRPPAVRWPRWPPLWAWWWAW